MGKNILLTGATGGLGKILAEFLMQEGHRLALTGKSETAGDITLLNDSFYTSCDLRNEHEIVELVREAEKRMGAVDVLINAAGVPGSGMSWKLTLEEWNECMAVNLTAPFLFMRELLPGMRARQFGRIINMSSVVAFKGVPGTAAYAASKAALDGLIRAVSAENIQKGIAVNNLALGYFDAGMLYRIPENIREEIRSTIPAGKFGNPQNITSLLRWLISDEADYITGQTLQINGGLYS